MPLGALPQTSGPPGAGVQQGYFLLMRVTEQEAVEDPGGWALPADKGRRKEVSCPVLPCTAALPCPALPCPGRVVVQEGGGRGPSWELLRHFDLSNH